MAPKGVYFTQKGTAYALGYNSVNYGIWSIDADDANNAPIVVFPKSPEGWQSAAAQFSNWEAAAKQGSSLGFPNYGARPDAFATQAGNFAPPPIQPGNWMTPNPSQMPQPVGQAGEKTDSVSLPPNNLGSGQSPPIQPHIPQPASVYPQGAPPSPPPPGFGYPPPAYQIPNPYMHPGVPYNRMPPPAQFPGAMPPMYPGANPYMYPGVNPYMHPGMHPPAIYNQGQTNSLSIVSFIAGIIGILTFPIFAIVPAIGLVGGIISLLQIKRSQLANMPMRGRGFAIAGIVLGSIGVALGILFLIGTIANSNGSG